MKSLNSLNINSPERSDSRFDGEYFDYDLKRFEDLAKYFCGGTYLDVGCQLSTYPETLKEKYPLSHIVGLDFSPKTIEFLKELDNGVEYVCADIFEYNEPADYVVAGEILEHMTDPQKFIDHCMSLLNPGGWLAISTPEDEGKGFWFDRDEHMWSFSETDILTLMPGAEIGRPQKHIIAAWKQNLAS